jgi:hypothetical protein
MFNENNPNRVRNAVIMTTIAFLIAICCCGPLAILTTNFVFDAIDVAQPAQAPATPAEVPNTSKEPIQDKDFQDVSNYPTVAKFSIGADFYCVGIRVGVALPEKATGYNHIEHWDKYQADGNYLHSPQTNMFSMAAYCGNDNPVNHLAPIGTEWKTGTWEADGFYPATFPLK